MFKWNHCDPSPSVCGTETNNIFTPDPAEYNLTETVHKPTPVSDNDTASNIQNDQCKSRDYIKETKHSSPSIRIDFKPDDAEKICSI